MKALYDEIEKLKENGLYRQLNTIQKCVGKSVFYRDKKLLNLSSNDYLALSTDEEIHKKFFKKIPQGNILREFSMSSTSSRLLTGNSQLYDELEKDIAFLYGKEAALVFNSGYHANIGILPALCGKKDAIFSDKLNHASIVDGMILSGANFFRYNHLDYEHLESLLSKNRKNFDKALLVSESVFSMDGDTADLKKIIELKNNYNAILLVDEAHAVGVFGEKGLGICEENNIISEIDIILGTFGKALASLGAFIVCDNIIKEYLVNRMRPLIFTTALPPIILGWNLFVLKIIPALKEKRRHLKDISAKLRYALLDKELATKGDSQIVPVILGDNETVIRISKKLQDEGFLIFPIRPPTVLAGTSRIRMSLNASVEWGEIHKIPDIIKCEIKILNKNK